MTDLVELGAKAFFKDAGLTWEDRSPEMQELMRKRIQAIYAALKAAGYEIKQQDDDDKIFSG